MCWSFSPYMFAIIPNSNYSDTRPAIMLNMACLLVCLVVGNQCQEYIHMLGDITLVNEECSPWQSFHTMVLTWSGCDFKIQFSDLFHWLLSSDLLITPPEECDETLMMNTQRCFIQSLGAVRQLWIGYKYFLNNYNIAQIRKTQDKARRDRRCHQQHLFTTHITLTS